MSRLGTFNYLEFCSGIENRICPRTEIQQILFPIF